MNPNNEYKAARAATVNWIIILALLATIMVAVMAAPVGDVTLTWNYPTLTTNNVFKIYASPTLGSGPASTWPVIAIIPGDQTNATVHITPGAMFFSMTTSNVWGESSFSNVAQTPALPLAPTLSIKAVQ